MNWEDLCNHCGDCCQMWDSEYACPLYSTDTARCSDYENRQTTIPDCQQLTPENIPRLYRKGILSDRCNYVRHLYGKELIWDVEPMALKTFDSAPIKFKMHYWNTRRRKK